MHKIGSIVFGIMMLISVMAPQAAGGRVNANTVKAPAPKESTQASSIDHTARVDMSYKAVNKNFSMEGIKKLLEGMSTNPSGENDLILNMLLATPYEKRQYIFPQLHENKGLSKKVLDHPEIAVWKGKMPTTIPPHLVDFASEHLAYLPPIYYLYLDPDMWVSTDSDIPSSSKINLSTQNMSIKTMPHVGEFYTFPKVQDLYKIDPVTAKNYKKTDLKPADVDRLFKSIDKINDYIESQEDPTEIKHMMISLMLRNNKIEQDLGDPFASLVARLQLIKSKKEIDDLFKSMGWKNGYDFATKADRILKAQRVTTLDLRVAMQMQKVRGYPDNPQNEVLTNLKTFARMHDAPPGDVYFVMPYAAEIRKKLKPNFILLLGTPVYIE